MKTGFGRPLQPYCLHVTSNRRRPSKLPTLRDTNPPHLWRIGYVLAASVLIAFAGLALLWWLALVILHHPRLPRPGTLALHDTISVVQLVFAAVAGAGALVALVMAYRRQRIAEADSAHDRTRVLNERFTAIAGQLGSDQAAIRLAGAHGMAGLADDWPENRQTCVDVLCAYLRMPFLAEPASAGHPQDRDWVAWKGSQEVRRTIIRLIVAHLQPGAVASWQQLNLDFTGAEFDDVDFGGAVFAGAQVSFRGARFSANTVFDGAQFCGGLTSFTGAEFSGGMVSFLNSMFSGFEISFIGARFSGGLVAFAGAKFSGAEVRFRDANFCGQVIIFEGAEFSGGLVNFLNVKFAGSQVSFNGTKFSGGKVDFGGARDLSLPPEWMDAPPLGVILPSRG
jgi:uncharacterized protein YjbI with pentapeptide repeats